MKFTKIVGFAPDLPYTTPGVLRHSPSVLPTARGICSPPVMTVATSSTIDTATVCGATQLAKADGTLKYYIGTAAKLWEFDGTTTLTDRSGTAYSASATQGWSFCAFGDVVLAANKGNTIQKANGGAFSDLSSAPKAAIICNVGKPSAPFIMALNYDDGTNTPDGWFCSGVADYTTWDSLAAESVKGRLLEPTGPFIAAVPFRDGILAWKKNAMYIGTYIGAPLVWDWQRVASSIGCCGKNMAVVADDVAYWADSRGFWMYDGSYPQPLPGAVHEYWAGITTGGASGSTYVIDDTDFMRWDSVNHNLWIAFHIGSAKSFLFWNKTSGTWTGDADFEAFTNTAGSGLASVISMHPLFTMHLDKKVSVGTFYDPLSGTGSNSVPTITTWVEGDPEERIFIDRVRPVFLLTHSPAGVAQVPLSGTCFLTTYQDATTSSGTQQSTVNMSTGDGFRFDTTGSGNFVGATISLTGGWEMTHIGISEANAGAKGKR